MDAEFCQSSTESERKSGSSTLYVWSTLGRVRASRKHNYESWLQNLGEVRGSQEAGNQHLPKSGEVQHLEVFSRSASDQVRKGS